MKNTLKKLLILTCLTAPAGSALAGGDESLPPLSSENAAQEDLWAVMAGTSLKLTLEGWCREAGWTLIWDSPSDYRLRASAIFPGSFELSASNLIDAVYLSHPEISATFHRGNKVLHVENDPLTSN